MIPEQDEFLPADRQLVQDHTRSRRVFRSVAEVLVAVRPAVRVRAEGMVRVLPRVKPGSAVIHLLNYDYDAGPDDVAVARNVKVQADLAVLGVGKAVSARFLAPEAEPVSLPVQEALVEVPRLGLWGILVFEAQP